MAREGAPICGAIFEGSATDLAKVIGMTRLVGGFHIAERLLRPLAPLGLFLRIGNQAKDNDYDFDLLASLSASAFLTFLGVAASE